MVDKYRKEQQKKLDERFEVMQQTIESLERRIDEVENRECIIEDRISQIMQLQRELVKHHEVVSG